MEVVIIIGIIIAIIFIVIKLYTFYNAKVAEALDIFIVAAMPYKILIGMHFDVETNNKKIKSWNEQHKIDFIINQNIKKIVKTLEVFNNLELWWQDSMPKVKEASLSRARSSALDMFLFGNRFISKATRDLENLVSTYNPEPMVFLLKTYTHHSNTRHYNPHTGSWSSDMTTFSSSLNASRLLERIEILAKYNFEMTEYQYECENQRSLMTPELRQRIIERDNGICQKCKKKCGYGDIEIDHIQPISKGGKTIASNLQVLCVSCNRVKSNKWLDGIKHDFQFKEENGTPEPVIRTITPQRPKKPIITKPYYRNYIKIGKFVKICYMDTNEEAAFQIVAEWDADRTNKKISVSSPIGSALLGQKENDIVTATTPSGEVKLQIVKIFDSEF